MVGEYGLKAALREYRAPRLPPFLLNTHLWRRGRELCVQRSHTRLVTERSGAFGFAIHMAFLTGYGWRSFAERRGGRQEPGSPEHRIRRVFPSITARPSPWENMGSFSPDPGGAEGLAKAIWADPSGSTTCRSSSSLFRVHP